MDGRLEEVGDQHGVEQGGLAERARAEPQHLLEVVPGEADLPVADPAPQAREHGVVHAVPPEVGVDHRSALRGGHGEAERGGLAQHGDEDLPADEPAGAVGPHLGGERLLGGRDLLVLHRGPGRPQLLDQGEKLQLGEHLA